MARPRRSQSTRLRLLEEGADVFLRQGFHGTGLLEVLSRAGVPKGSFYNYFPSKEAFGAEVVRHYAREFDVRLDSAAEQAAKDAPAALERFFRQLTKEFAAAGHGGGCLVGNLSGQLEDSELCRTAMADALRGWAERIARIVALGQSQGSLRKDLSAADAAAFVLDSWEGAVLRMKVERSDRPLRRWIDLVLRGWIRA
jgi:TetR/AcrR family transcriptional regulator, transcriptional repressor for nem operon